MNCSEWIAVPILGFHNGVLYQRHQRECYEYRELGAMSSRRHRVTWTEYKWIPVPQIDPKEM